MGLSNEITEYLTSKGAVVVKFADLSEVDLSKINNENLNFDVKSGISYGITMPKDLIESIRDGPTKEYYDFYNWRNEKIDEITLDCENFLKDKGYNVYGQTRKRNKISKDVRTVLPHKKVATMAGVGWIGKSAMLVNPEYGNSISLGSLLTDEVLDYGTPITSSMCGTCTNCVDICPAGALNGKLWDTTVDRSEFFDIKACRTKATEITLKTIGIKKDTCGRCITVCPYTKKYMKRGY